MQLKKVRTKRSNENYYLYKTVNLHCANSILIKLKQPFSKFASVSRANLENKAKLTDTKTLKLADSISAYLKRGLIMV